MVSVIIPVYNVEDYIEDTLASVLNQTYRDFEVILVDDGSVDRSIEYAERVFQKYNFNKYIILKEKNSGQGIARNYGMDFAKGDWIFFMDSDDLLNKCTLEIMTSKLIDSQTDMVFCGFCFVEHNKKITNLEEKTTTYKYTREKLQLDFLTRKAKILVPGTIYRSSFLKENDIDFPGLRFSEDIFFLWKALGKVRNAVYIKNKLYMYVVRNNSTMTSSKQKVIIDSYNEYKVLDKIIQKSNDYIEPVKKWMFARWTMGILRSSTKLMEWSEYRKFAENVNYRNVCRNLQGFPDFKIKLLTCIMQFRLSVYYKIFSR